MATRRPEKIEILQLPKSVIGRVIGKVGSFVFFLPWEGIFDGCPGRQEPRSKTFVSVQDAAVAFKSFNCIFGWGLLSSFFAVKFFAGSQWVHVHSAGARIDARDQTEDPVQDGKEKYFNFQNLNSSQFFKAHFRWAAKYWFKDGPVNCCQLLTHRVNFLGSLERDTWSLWGCQGRSSY